MRTMKTLAIAAFAASALALAGCGGGGSSSSSEPPAPPAPKTVSLPDNIPAGMAPSGTHEIAAGETATSNGVTFTCAAGGEACMVMVAADGTAATYTGGMVTASLSQAAQTAIDNANKVADADKMKADADAKANSATAKALKAAIDTPATSDGSAAITVTPISIPAIDLDGAGSETVLSDALTLKKGDSVGSLAGWGGMDYAGEAGTGTGKTTGMVRVYSNQAAPKSVAFGPTSSGLTQPPNENHYTVAAANNDDIESSSLPSVGQTTLTGNAREFDGTFKGAPGTYECTTANDCVVNKAGIVSGTWQFTPKPGAMVQQEDTQYLQFGWWLRKDKDGPTYAGAFYREEVPSGGTATTPVSQALINGAELTGKATYTGGAAGKFAISDPLRPANDDAGHFTADAELVADFQNTGATPAGTSTLTGTIDNFRLNDGSANPGWSVELQKTVPDSNGRFITGDRANDQTVWSIGGAKGAVSGAWEAVMYDDPDDDSNVPTSVVGTFNSEIGSTHSMVGAFGAEKQ